MNAQIGLVNPKYPHNLGSAIRIAACYGITRIWYNGRRMDIVLKDVERIPREERLREYRSVHWKKEDYFISTAIREGYVPVCVEFRPDKSESLIDFEHPDKALYVFGPEDGSIERGISTACHRFIHIPTAHCLNLATAIGTVIYDRKAKERIAA